MRASLRAIVTDQEDLIAQLRDRFEDFDPLVHCWACGEERKLQRAHIMPASAGGPDVGKNYFLLCRRCHQEQPDNASEEAQRQWLFAQRARGWRAFYWLKDNLCTPLIARAEAIAPGLGAALIGRWLSSFGASEEERRNNFYLLMDGKYGATGALLDQGRLNTAKFEVLAHFEHWLEEQCRKAFLDTFKPAPSGESAWASDEGLRSLPTRDAC